MRAENQVYIGMGSNIDPEINLPMALRMLQNHVRVLAVSPAYRTAPVGSTGPYFMNAAVHVTSTYSLRQLKQDVLRRLEKKIGRVRTRDKNAPRPIDLDILIFNQEIIDPNLWLYAHIVVPLAQLLPALQHPVTGMSLSELAEHHLDQATSTLVPELPLQVEQKST